jgi:hypothetical protein
MKHTFIQLTNLSGLTIWLNPSQIISMARVGKATYIRCTDDFPDADASNVVRCVTETPDQILTALDARCCICIEPSNN